MIDEGLETCTAVRCIGRLQFAFIACVRHARRMPPKKKDTKAPPLIGRFGTALKCGIVGLPNVGYVSDRWLFIVVSNDTSFLQEVNVFQRFDKKCSCSREFPILYH